MSFALKDKNNIRVFTSTIGILFKENLEVFMRFHQNGVSFRIVEENYTMIMRLKKDFFAEFKRIELKHEDKVDFEISRNVLDCLNSVADTVELMFVVHYLDRVPEQNNSRQDGKSALLRVSKDQGEFTFNSNISINLILGYQEDVVDFNFEDNMSILNSKVSELRPLRSFRKVSFLFPYILPPSRQKTS